MSKIYERCIHNSLSSYAETKLSNSISPYNKSYSSNHVLLRLIENCKNYWDNKDFVGTVLMDLSKAFDCIAHDLLDKKLHLKGWSEYEVTFVHSYLKRKKHGVKINDTQSVFQMLFPGTPQGFRLGLIFFNILINDFIFFNKDV